MNNITKKPHFVPAAYLQFWDATGSYNGRESSIYWCNGEITTKQVVKKVAVQSGLYSETDPNSAEDYFSEFESDWSKLVKQLLSGNAPRADVMSGLLLFQSSYFLLRNPKLSNESGSERITAYQKAIEGYFREVLMGGKVPPTKEEGLAKLSENWSCHLLPSQKEPWITSDNPTLILSFNGHIPALIFLPITPKWALLATKNGVMKLTSQNVTSKDVEYLNSYTAINSIRQIYSNKPFDEQEAKSLSKWFTKRPQVDNWLGENEMHLEPFVYPIKGMELSFL